MDLKQRITTDFSALTINANDSMSIKEELEQDPDRPPLKCLQISLLIIGACNVGKTKVIENFVNYDDPIIKDQYYQYYLDIEFNEYMISLTLNEPINQEIEKFSPIFEQSMKINDFDGIVMISAHTDQDGQFLKQSLEYLGSVQEIIVRKMLSQLPSVLIINNEITADLMSKASRKVLQKQNWYRDAVKFGKVNLNSEVFEVDIQSSENELTIQIDNAFAYILQETIYIKKHTKSKPRQFSSENLYKHIEKFKGWSRAFKLKIIFQTLLICQSVLFLYFFFHYFIAIKPLSIIFKCNTIIKDQDQNRIMVLQYQQFQWILLFFYGYYWILWIKVFQQRVHRDCKHNILIITLIVSIRSYY